jgi:predicted  nucleic acid-binding Zn-ribbon protein
MSAEHPANTSLSFWGRLGKGISWLVRFVLRLLLVLIIGAALGAGVYGGILVLYRQYILPVQVHSIRLDVLATRQAQANQQANQRLDDLQARLDALEIQGDTRKEDLSSLQVRLDAAETAQASQVGSLAALESLHGDLNTLRGDLEGLQGDWQATQAALESLQAAQDTVQAGLEELQATDAAAQEDLQALQGALRTARADVEAMQTRVARVSQGIASNSQGIESLSAELHGETSPAVLLRELQLVRVMEELTRSRLLLLQNNLGLAQLGIQSGREQLLALQAQVPAYQAQALADIVSLLDAALANLPNAPVAAADELDGAWQLLVQGLPEAPAVTPVPEVPVQVSPTPEATLVVTSTVTPTPTATSSP